MDMNFNQLLNAIAFIAPNKYLQAVLIILLFSGAAKIVDWVMSRILTAWLSKTRVSLDDLILDIFHKPIFISIFLFGLGLAAERLALPATPRYLAMAGLKTVVIFIWAGAALRFLKLVIHLLSRDESRFALIQDRTVPLFNNLMIILVTVISLYFVFLAWDIDVSAWLASAGILGLAISFAAKDTLANLFSGVFIVADAPYKIGDFIVLSSGERGEVTHIGIRSTRILTRDDVEITVPNSMIANSKIINEAGGPHEKYRIRVKVGVAYGSDIDKVKAVLLEVAQNHPLVCAIPEPRVRFRNFGDSSLDHELLCWVEKPVFRGRALHQLNTLVYKRFSAEGIEIPFPQTDLHIRSIPDPLASKN